MPISQPSESAVPPIRQTVESADRADAARPTTLHHWVLLMLCCSALLMSLAMKTPDDEHVVLPIVNVPLPKVCATRRWLGIECPGCGLTRCFISIAHGRLDRAFQFNAAGILFFLVVISQLPYRTLQIWRIRRGQKEYDGMKFTWLLWLLLAAMLAQWLIKMAARFL